jgi:hypothetical protein
VSEFEHWVRSVFDHPGEGPEWYWDPEFEPAEPEPTQCALLLSELFAHAGAHLAAYADSQVARGLWFLAGNGLSDYSLALVDARVDVSIRSDCFAAIPTLFDQVFRPRCPSILSHRATQNEFPINTTCYMWWDLFPSWGEPKREIDDDALSAMSCILELDSLACQESALHGLGHWCSAYPAQVGEAIDRFLVEPRPPELEAYALAAREGCVQ